MREYRVKCKRIAPTEPGAFNGMSAWFDSFPAIVENNKEYQVYEFTTEYDLDRILDQRPAVIEYRVEVV